MKRVLVLFVVGVVLFGSCSAQNDNVQDANVAQSSNAKNENIEQRIIGTWVDHKGETWVFNANGNLTQTYQSGTTVESKFAVTDTQLAFSPVTNYSNYGIYGTGNALLDVYNISISSDGRTLIFEETYSDYKRGYAYWLTKQ